MTSNMKTENELIILRRIIVAYLDIEEPTFEYQEYLKQHTISLDVRPKINLLHTWQDKLSNLMLAIRQTKDVFAYNPQLWSDVNKKTEQLVTIPDRLSKFFVSEDVADLRLYRILSVARNWGQHINKTNQVAYRYLADSLDFQMLLDVLHSIYLLLQAELSSLSTEEIQTYISSSYDFKENTIMLQGELEKILPYIFLNPNCTEEQKHLLQTFMDFVPSKAHVILE